MTLRPEIELIIDVYSKPVCVLWVTSVYKRAGTRRSGRAAAHSCWKARTPTKKRSCRPAAILWYFSWDPHQAPRPRGNAPPDLEPPGPYDMVNCPAKAFLGRFGG